MKPFNLDLAGPERLAITSELESLARQNIVDRVAAKYNVHRNEVKQKMFLHLYHPLCTDQGLLKIAENIFHA